MKLSISFLATNYQKLTEADDKHKLRTFYEKRVAQKLVLTFWVKNGRLMWFNSGENYQQGYPMKKGVLTHVHLLRKGHSCQTMENWVKEAQICLGLHCRCNLSALNLVTVKRGKKDVPGLTGVTLSHRLKPKRAAEASNFSASLQKIMLTNML